MKPRESLPPKYPRRSSNPPMPPSGVTMANLRSHSLDGLLDEKDQDEVQASNNLRTQSFEGLLEKNLNHEPPKTSQNSSYQEKKTTKDEDRILDSAVIRSQNSETVRLEDAVGSGNGVDGDASHAASPVGLLEDESVENSEIPSPNEATKQETDYDCCVNDNSDRTSLKSDSKQRRNFVDRCLNRMRNFIRK